MRTRSTTAKAKAPRPSWRRGFYNFCRRASGVSTVRAAGVVLRYQDTAEHGPLLRQPQGLRPIGPVAKQVIARAHIARASRLVADPTFQRRIARLHDLGQRAVAELLAEIGAMGNCTALIDTRLARYAQINPAALAVAGGNRFPARVLHAVLS